MRWFLRPPLTGKTPCFKSTLFIQYPYSTIKTKHFEHSKKSTGERRKQRDWINLRVSSHHCSIWLTNFSQIQKKKKIKEQSTARKLIDSPLLTMIAEVSRNSSSRFCSSLTDKCITHYRVRCSSVIVTSIST